MKKVLLILACTIVVPALAHAQSSGNFSATGTSAACIICNGNNSSNPACSGVGVGQFGGGTTLTNFTADISTSNGNGVTLDIRPDLVTGLFTDTKISTTVSTATAEVGLQVCVTVDGSGANVLPTNCVIYDERFQQLSSQLFSQLTECTNVPIAGSVCSTNSPSCASVCPAGDVCSCNFGTTGTCTIAGTACSNTAPCTTAGDTCNFSGSCVEQNNLCNIELLLSTLSAHSFDFVVSMPGTGPHVVEATWSVVDVVNNGNSSPVAACVGPGILTVTQDKVFKNSGALSFSSL